MVALIETDDLIGKPFKKGGRDIATGADCFGVLMECHRRWGRVIPDFRSPEFYHEMEEALNVNKANGWAAWWEKKSFSDMVPMSLCQPGRTLHIAIKGAACHVGFVYKPGWFIHAWEDTNGITAERVTLWQRKVFGVYEFVG